MRREVRIGKLGVGGRNPVRVKGMLKSSLENEKRFIKEARGLQDEGAEALRVAFRERKDRKIPRILEKEIEVPLVADIHFNPQLALLAIEAGFAGIRLNPLNISKAREVRQIINEARQAGISVRIGVNSGGFKKKFTSSYALAKALVKVASDYIKLFEDEGFFDIIVSLKAADVWTTVLANRIIAKRFSYPLHLGVTATGPYLEGVVKSSLGIGILLSEGIGDIVRVSLTAPSREEIKVAKGILQSLGKRRFFPEIISCPTCSRAQVDIAKIVNDFKNKIKDSTKELSGKRIAIMGCMVNGPGEARQADIGVAFGKIKGAIFKGGDILGYTTQDRAVRDLLKMI
jgi:(E)-4-hydroxy-3-methylbut-2-enyl-diphosphate synthase